MAHGAKHRMAIAVTIKIIIASNQWVWNAVLLLSLGFYYLKEEESMPISKVMVIKALPQTVHGY